MLSPVANSAHVAAVRTDSTLETGDAILVASVYEVCPPVNFCK